MKYFNIKWICLIAILSFASMQSFAQQPQENAEPVKQQLKVISKSELAKNIGESKSFKTAKSGKKMKAGLVKQMAKARQKVRTATQRIEAAKAKYNTLKSEGKMTPAAFDKKQEVIRKAEAKLAELASMISKYKDL